MKNVRNITGAGKFIMVTHRGYKNVAKQEAEKYRRKGNLVRIIKDANGYAIFIKHRH